MIPSVPTFPLSICELQVVKDWKMLKSRNEATMYGQFLELRVKFILH